MSNSPSKKSATHPVQDYKSRVSDPASRKFETFSYIPRMDDKAIRRQAQYLLARGWTPAIEHVEPDRSAAIYWYMWKLPMFGERNVDAVLREAAACRKANPENHVRLVGYDPIRQSLGASMVIYRGKGY